MNLPNSLTVFRIFCVPLLVVVLLTRQPNVTVFGLPMDFSVWGVLILLAGAATDWADGFYARRWKQITTLGILLDPVADKLMVAAALIVLTEKGIVDPFASLIIIGREITISALREWMATIGQSKSVAVNVFGKVKTIAQLIAIPFLLFNGVLFGLFHTVVVGRWLIWIAAFLTLWSMVVYLKAAWAAGEPK